MPSPFKILLSALMACALATALYAEPADETWSRTKADGQNQVLLYFFWSKTCPHCERAKPFVDKLGKNFDWLAVSSHEITEYPENARLFKNLTEMIGEKVSGVPAFLFCGKMIVGYDREETSGKDLIAQLGECRDRLEANRPKGRTSLLDKEAGSVSVPYLGKIDPARVSLPVFTIIIAGLDAFNPCAFFVLLLLLSLIANVHSQRRILLIGGIFVFFSGFIYFIFMAAWLNLFLLLGELKVITSIAAAIAIGISLINIKDYFWFKQGVSFSIPESAKPGLYNRIRLLANTSSFPVLIFGTAALAIAANTYELLCTSGFPMVFTRVLTLNSLPKLNYYFYLAFYNVVYVIPLGLIVLAFAVTLRSRKLSEDEGRILKLASGLMMLGLGLLLWFSPESLSNLFIAAGLLAGAVSVAVIIIIIQSKLSTLGISHKLKRRN